MKKWLLMAVLCLSLAGCQWFGTSETPNDANTADGNDAGADADTSDDSDAGADAGTDDDSDEGKEESEEE